MTLHRSPELSKSPVCVVGNLCVDLIIRNVPAMPAWGEEVIGTSHMLVSSGQTGYTAFALRRLGVSTSVVGNVGEDLNGKQLVNDLRSYGVDTDGVLVAAGKQTGITVAIVREDGERGFVSTLGCSQDFTEAMIRQHWDKLAAASVVCLVGLFCMPKLTFEPATCLLCESREAGCITMLDTGWDPNKWQPTTVSGLKEMLKEVTLFMPNLDEARAITGKATGEEAVVALQELGVEIPVIKCGSEGSYCREDDHTYFAASRQVKVLDAVGAGDTFNAGFLYGFREGWPLDACLALGNTTASLYISRATDRWPWLEEVMAAAKISYPWIPEK